MDSSSRRHILKDLGLGTAFFSQSSERAQANRMPGQQPPRDAETRSSGPSNIMAIAAHPGEAFCVMGVPVALHVQFGGRGVFLSLSLGEKRPAQIRTPVLQSPGT